MKNEECRMKNAEWRMQNREWRKEKIGHCHSALHLAMTDFYRYISYLISRISYLISHLSFMVLTARLDGLGPVDLLQNHDPGQMMREGHRPHGQLKICPLLDPGSHAKGGTDEKTGA